MYSVAINLHTHYCRSVPQRISEQNTTPLTPAFSRQISWVWGLPGLPSEFQGRQGYPEEHCAGIKGMNHYHPASSLSSNRIVNQSSSEKQSSSPPRVSLSSIRVHRVALDSAIHPLLPAPTNFEATIFASSSDLFHLPGPFFFLCLWSKSSRHLILPPGGLQRKRWKKEDCSWCGGHSRSRTSPCVWGGLW